jgi:hypothetical protein
METSVEEQFRGAFSESLSPTCSRFELSYVVPRTVELHRTPGSGVQAQTLCARITLPTSHTSADPVPDVEDKAEDHKDPSPTAHSAVFGPIWSAPTAPTAPTALTALPGQTPPSQ